MIERIALGEVARADLAATGEERVARTSPRDGPYERAWS
jgi:hypothetical protein